MTVAQNIRFPLEMFSEMTEHQMDERVKFVMNRVRLEGKIQNFLVRFLVVCKSV